MNIGPIVKIIERRLDSSVDIKLQVASQRFLRVIVKHWVNLDYCMCSGAIASPYHYETKASSAFVLFFS